MDAKDLRTETALSDRSNDGNSKYPQGSGVLQCNRSKPYQEMGPTNVAKVDVQTARPCAVIGPDRVVPPSTNVDAYIKKGPVEPWPNTESTYRRPPEYPHKLPDYHHPNRNISPRQTYQENMPRIMLPPSYNAIKPKEDHHYPVDANSQLRNTKINVPTETKYCEVPYPVNSIANEQKNPRNPEVSVSNMNPALVRSAIHGWPPANVNVRPSKPYGAPELYPYPEYQNCAGPRPMILPRTHRTTHEDPSHIYPEAYYHEGGIRFKPYPTVKDRYPQARYEYLNNYSNPYQPAPSFPPHKYDLQKSVPPQPYPPYTQVPLKYLENRMSDSIMNGYQRPLNQSNFNSVPYRNQMVHPSYANVGSSCLQPNKFYAYPPENSVKPMASNKLPYEINQKIYGVDYENRNLRNPMAESFYVNEMTRPHQIKGQMLPSGYPPVNMHAMPQHAYYRRENPSIKNYEIGPGFRNIDPSIGLGAGSLSRLPSQFSPNTISPSDSNTSNETIHTQSQDDCGYVSQSSSASIRSMDSGFNRLSHEFYRGYGYRYGPVVKNSHLMSKSDGNHLGPKNTKKDIDVRQFLQMWNEGEEEGSENANKEVTVTANNSNDLANRFETASQEQLYVLGLVNVPSEELGKYEHIQKVSKLPENIKGYNSIELLNQFEEVIESSNMNNYNTKQSMSRDFHGSMKNSMSMQGMTMSSRPLSPLDVESKISQSVIHKEVGCNFEIKPCSPKMLNVEVAAPIQTILGERVIEKVTNPLILPSQLMHNVNDSSFNAVKHQDRKISLNGSPKVPSCKMINTQYSNSNAVDSIKTNYSFQDLESNSGVCLASLPRLDNDIELNFPEVNQQFINANKVETVITTTPKELPALCTDQLDSSAHRNAKQAENAQSSPTVESEKEFSKLSKYRKMKRKGSENKEVISESNARAMRTDSVIIKNPENMKAHEGSPDPYTSVKAFSQGSQQDPINLSVNTESQSDSIENKSVMSNIFKDDTEDMALDFSLNSGDHLPVQNQETFTSNVLKENDFQNSLDQNKNHNAICQLTNVPINEDTANIINKSTKKENNIDQKNEDLNIVDNLDEQSATALCKPSQSHDTEFQSEFSSAESVNDISSEVPKPAKKNPTEEVIDDYNSSSKIITSSACETQTLSNAISTINDSEDQTPGINDDINSNNKCATKRSHYKISNARANFHQNLEFNAHVELCQSGEIELNMTDLLKNRNVKNNVKHEFENVVAITESSNDSSYVSTLPNSFFGDTKKKRKESKTMKNDKSKLDSKLRMHKELFSPYIQNLISNTEGQTTVKLKAIFNETDKKNTDYYDTEEITLSKGIATKGETSINNKSRGNSPKTDNIHMLNDESDRNVVEPNNINLEDFETRLSVNEITTDVTLDLFQDKEKTSEEVRNEDIDRDISLPANTDTASLLKDISMENKEDTSKNNGSCGISPKKDNIHVFNDESDRNVVEPNNINLEDFETLSSVNEIATDVTLDSFQVQENTSEKVNNKDIDINISLPVNTDTSSLETSEIEREVSSNLISVNHKICNSIETFSIVELNKIKDKISNLGISNNDSFTENSNDKVEKGDELENSNKLEKMETIVSKIDDNLPVKNYIDPKFDKNNIQDDEQICNPVKDVINKPSYKSIIELESNEKYVCAMEDHLTRKWINSVGKFIHETNYMLSNKKAGADCEAVESLNLMKKHTDKVSKKCKKEIKKSLKDINAKSNLNMVDQNVFDSISADLNITVLNQLKKSNGTLKSETVNETLDDELSRELNRVIEDTNANEIKHLNTTIESVVNIKDTNGNKVSQFTSNADENIDHITTIHTSQKTDLETIHNDSVANLEIELYKNDIDVSINETTTEAIQNTACTLPIKNFGHKTTEESVEIDVDLDTIHNKTSINEKLYEELAAPREEISNTALNQRSPKTEHNINVFSTKTSIFEESEMVVRSTETPIRKTDGSPIKTSCIDELTYNGEEHLEKFNTVNDNESDEKSEERTDEVTIDVTGSKINEDDSVEFETNDIINIRSQINITESTALSAYNENSYYEEQFEPTHTIIDSITKNKLNLSPQISMQTQDNGNEKSEIDLPSANKLNEWQSVPRQTNNSTKTKENSLKRSLSESALDICSNSLYGNEKQNDYVNCSYLWPNKRKKIIVPENAENQFVTENYCNIIHHNINNRRNSISTVYNDENVYILIDNNCIITSDCDDDSEKICFTELPEDCLPCMQNDMDSGEENTESESDTFALQQNLNFEYSDACTEALVEEQTQESWVEDVACVETVISEDIAEDIIVSALSSPKDRDLTDDESTNEETIFDLNDYTDKVKYIYGDKMCSDDAHLVETLYRTPQMDVNRTLIYRESQVTEDCSRYYDKESLEKVLSESNTSEITVAKVNESTFEAAFCTPQMEDTFISAPKENVDLSSVNNYSPVDSEINLLNILDKSDCNDEIKDVTEERSLVTQDQTVHSYESSVDNEFTYNHQESPQCSISSSPEVSSTTSEDKSSSILLKITNYGGSRMAQVNSIDSKGSYNTVCCKYTEKKDYLNSASNCPKRPLLTKAAQKYIPPLKETIGDLKVKLSLPEHSLLKLKQLKMSKEEPKTIKQNKNNVNMCRKDVLKKSKPKFEDVLKSIDEIQFKMHKEKNKKVKKTIPKVVIKKNENGSHYASTTNNDKYNPDLTGRKWQPWVFLEKNAFIDKMAKLKQTKAVFSHRKNVYVLAETFKKYKSISNTNFIISQPKRNTCSNGQLKYTIRFKHTY